MNKNDSIAAYLLEIGQPAEWKDWLFHLQTSVIDSDHMAMLNDAGRGDFATRCQALYNFFSDLEKRQGEKQ